MQEALILVGTETGTAEYVAGELAAALSAAGLTVRCVDMLQATPALLVAHEQVIVCTSTHGDGDLPLNAERFYVLLLRERPRLQHLRFAVCALGDHLYDPYFCQAGKTFEALLEQLGATRVLDRFEIDGEPETEYITAAQAWARQVAAAWCAVGAPVALRNVGVGVRSD